MVEQGVDGITEGHWRDGGGLDGVAEDGIFGKS
jgi:hypothetical protein